MLSIVSGDLNFQTVDLNIQPVFPDSHERKGTIDIYCLSNPRPEHGKIHQISNVIRWDLGHHCFVLCIPNFVNYDSWLFHRICDFFKTSVLAHNQTIDLRRGIAQ